MTEEIQPTVYPSTETAMEPQRDGSESAPRPEPLLSQDTELLNRILEQLAVLTHKVTFCEQAIAKRIKDDFVKEKAFNVLYEELRQYKENFILESQKPLFRSLMLLYDDMARTIQHTQSKRVKQSVQLLREELEEIFVRNEIEIIEHSPRKFDNQFQQAVKAEPTREASEDMDVLQVVRFGFRRKQNILRPQEVVVKRFQPF